MWFKKKKSSQQKEQEAEELAIQESKELEQRGCIIASNLLRYNDSLCLDPTYQPFIFHGIEFNRESSEIRVIVSTPTIKKGYHVITNYGLDWQKYIKKSRERYLDLKSGLSQMGVEFKLK